MKPSTDFLYSLRRDLLKLRRAGPREQTDGSREKLI